MRTKPLFIVISIVAIFVVSLTSCSKESNMDIGESGAEDINPPSERKVIAQDTDSVSSSNNDTTATPDFTNE